MNKSIIITEIEKKKLYKLIQDYATEISINSEFGTGNPNKVWNEIESILDKPMTEMDNNITATVNEQTDEKIIALAEFLNVDSSLINHEIDNLYEYKNKEYLVLDEFERVKEAKQDIKSLIDDCGINCIRGYENFMREDYFDDLQRNMNKQYCQDIKDERDSDFANRLIAECYDNNIIGDDDFETYEYDEYEANYVVCLVDENELIEKYTDFLCKQESSSEWIKNIYGESEIYKHFPNAFDIEGLINYVINTDGYGHILSSYDGHEHKQGQYYIYRTN